MFFLGMLATVVLYWVCFGIAYISNTNFFRWDFRCNEFDLFVVEPLTVFFKMVFIGLFLLLFCGICILVSMGVVALFG